MRSGTLTTCMLLPTCAVCGNGRQVGTEVIRSKHRNASKNLEAFSSGRARKVGPLVSQAVLGYNQLDVKNLQWRAENSAYSHHGRCPTPKRARARKGSALAHPEEHRTTLQVEAERLRLIQQRLQSDFYEVPPASEQIAAAVLAALTDHEEGASSLPH